MTTANGTLRSAFVELLAPYAWSHVATATSRYDEGVEKLFREFRNGFVRRLTKMAQGAIPFFVVAERTHAEHAHLHAVIAGSESLQIKQIEAAWKYGFTRIERFDPDRGALPYLAKGISRDNDDFDLSARFPPLRLDATSKHLPETLQRDNHCALLRDSASRNSWCGAGVTTAARRLPNGTMPGAQSRSLSDARNASCACRKPYSVLVGNLGKARAKKLI